MYLLPGFNVRSAVILVHPWCEITKAPPPHPVAYDITISSPLQDSCISMGARKAQCVANKAEKGKKKRDLAAKLTAIPGQFRSGRSSIFVAPAFESLGSPLQTSYKVIETTRHRFLLAADVLLEEWRTTCIRIIINLFGPHVRGLYYVLSRNTQISVIWFKL